MLGDSADETLKGYFEDLMGDEVAKASKDELAQAIDVVDKYQQKLLGDETSEPTEPEKQEQKPESEPSKEDKKPETGDGCNTAEPPKQTGDAGIDYDLLATKVVERLKSEKKEETQKQTGDELEDNPVEASRMSMLLAGDSTDKEVSSDTVMKEIWG